MGCAAQFGGRRSNYLRDPGRRCRLGPTELRKSRARSRGHGKDVGLTVEGRDQTVNAFLLQDGSELRAPGCHFADGAVEVDVGDQPAVAIAAHHVVDLDRLAVAFDDLAAYYDSGWRGLLTSHLQLQSVVGVEAVRIDRRDVAFEALGDLMPLGLGQTGPGRTDRQPRHPGSVEAPANDRLQLGETTA